MIQIKNLTKKFKTSRGLITVLDDFNLTINEGTFLGIKGKSGAGKSTFLSLIAGLEKPDSGTIEIDGTQINTLNQKQIALFRNKNIGFISQEQSFLENLTVFDNVRLPASICEWGNVQNNASCIHITNKNSQIASEHPTQTQIQERANQLLANLGIAHLANQYPTELSGGENHRVLIARALINNPPLILADEPTDSVDDERTLEIISIFRNLADQGKTVIIVSHDQQALKLCDKIITL